ncbi:MAG: polysaccharide pyruvyl transferase family protein [Synergistaceae bacterium]|jgi:pyruvyl transferase EpsI|nr:polysaccharide pyruvyl transferase family protein [Synergistaceae bacterium]
MSEIITKTIKDFLRTIQSKFAYRDTLTRLRDDSSQHRLMLFCCPEHKNLGDHAITAAVVDFFASELPQYPLIKISEILGKYNLSEVKKYIRDTDIILINAGGFLGTLYMSWSEEPVRNIIQAFPENKIVVLPQTVYYEDTPWGEEQLEKTKMIWQSHHNLSVFLREERSYDLVKKRLYGGYFNAAFCVPDIVLELNKTEPKRDRHGGLLCFRDDKESILSKIEIQAIESAVSQNFGQYFYVDTVIDRIFVKDFDNELKNMFDKFRRAQIVVTDRLHGLIFSAITSTPCVALNNVSRKVEYISKWLDEFNYIKFADRVDDAVKDIVALKTLQDTDRYDNTGFMPFFKKIAIIVED